MKIWIALLLTAPFLFTGCVSVLSGGSAPSMSTIRKANTQPPRDITFSVEFTDELPEMDSFTDKEEVVLAIREAFEESGMFGKVHYVEPNQPGPYHLRFKVIMTGTSMNRRLGNGVLAGFTLTTIPVWQSTELDWSMIVFSNGQEVFSASTEESLTDIIWLPAIIGSPFFNHGTMTGSLHERAARYFLNEIQKSRLNVSL